VARLAIDKDFLDDYSKLPKTVQSSVKTAIDKFAEFSAQPPRGRRLLL
jgi:mRNA-degrading endonuclease RelE of RelBE toxin-antitoxin system